MIRLEQVSRRWPEFAIRDVSLDVDEGQYLAIIGPTGAGKTLLLELLLGIHHPDQGRIFVGGQDVTALPPERRGIGMVYQDYALFPHLDVQHNLAFGLRYRPVPRAEHPRLVHETARLLGIDHLLHRFPGTLSGGEQQRVAIGRALVTGPRVLLLDEPFNALDRGTAERLRGELRALHLQQGLTVLHVTHDLGEARAMGGRIALIHEGRVHGIGTADELLRRPATLFAAQFIGAVNLFAARVEVRGGERLAVAGPIAAPAAADSATAHVMVHPDEVVLLDGHAPDAANVLCGEVAGLRDEQHHTAVLVRIAGLPEPLAVYLGRQPARALQLGRPVTADLRHALHVLHD
jgi:ABC-type sugar transport system ATPase subunit